jgi:TATA-box binding protein (TBP) (component of TFIID and TFIIIB)
MILVTREPLTLNALANALNNAVYDPQQFSALRLKHKKVGGSILLFGNGYTVCHGPAANRFEARRRIRRYARLVQKSGYSDLKVTASEILTVMLAANVGRRLNLNDVCNLGSTYEPELHNALIFSTMSTL